MSGYIEKPALQQLLQKYGSDKICVDSLSLPDPTLYKTIWKMHQKYGNAHIRFRGNYANLENKVKNTFRDTRKHLAEYEHGRARYNVIDNTMHLYNLDSLALNFMNCTPELKKKYAMVYEVEDNGFPSISSLRDQKRYLINNWMMELSHAYQAMHQ